jgi:hydroxymethylbilane synthase
MTKIIIGTRGSKLALWQAHFIEAQLKEIGVAVELKIITTKGDAIQHLSFDKIEGKGFFTKELEDALLSGEIDLAVHSMKDLPTTQPPGLRIAAVSYRDAPEDWLIIRKAALVEENILRLKEKPIIGTSSARRKSQILGMRPDAEIKDIRGNVPTRLDKLASGDYDAILLAGAGLSRLEIDLSDFEVIKFSPHEFVPAPAQGVLALQIRAEDKLLYRLLRKIHHSDVLECTNVERKVLRMFDGGCQLPLGVYCECNAQGQFNVWAVMAEAWNAPLKRVRLSSTIRTGLAERVHQAILDAEFED